MGEGFGDLSEPSERAVYEDHSATRDRPEGAGGCHGQAHMRDGSRRRPPPIGSWQEGGTLQGLPGKPMLKVQGERNPAGGAAPGSLSGVCEHPRPERGGGTGPVGEASPEEVGLQAKQGGQRGCGRNKGPGSFFSSDPKLLPASPIV